jgi:hypothetical protein
MKRGTKIVIMLLLSVVTVINSQNNMAVLSLNESLEVTNTSWNAAAPGNLSFKTVGGMIMLNGAVNGEQACFILDTGSPGLVINQIPDWSDSNITAYGPTGVVAVEEVRVQSFELGALTYEGLQGLAINLSHLESAVECSLGGLVGSELFREFDLLIDYPNQQLSAFAPGNLSLPTERPDMVFPLEMEDHLPVITVNVQGRTLRLGLDTGSGGNILDDNFIEWAGESALVKNQGDRIRGLNQKAQSAQSAWLWVEGTGNTLPEPMRFLFSDLGPIQQQLDGPVDGLLGYAFFRNKKVLFSFSQQQILVWH